MGITQLGDIPDKATILQELIQLVRNNQTKLTDPIKIAGRETKINTKIMFALHVGANHVEIKSAIRKGKTLASENYKTVFRSER